MPSSYRQEALVPHEALQLRLDLGWDRPRSQGMFSLEAFVPATSDLVAFEVQPRRSFDTLAHFMLLAQSRQRALMLDLLDPPPF